MKNSLVITGLTLALVLVAPAALAGHERYGNKYFDTAKVVQVEPIIRMVRVNEPREECYEEEIVVRRGGYRSATPTIAGGIIGAVIGNQFGSGHGKDFMTIAGTVLGGSIGRDIGYHHDRYGRYVTTTETRCDIVDNYHEEERVDGYRVTYRYHGEEFVTTMPYHPGKRIKIKVAVKPVE
ncbi:MAG: glycine zipper 2TM domain-containing protein [Gammaproteobacteria bacterium]|nr:MAG: glycine zipper 2TM domain-containing protein [Gammaproteobacteria bacterium]